MIRNGNRVPKEAILRADVCIVGAGAAGITLAQALAGSHLRVIVLESGGQVRDEATQQLYAGANIGVPQPPLDASRLRWLGGTTNHWAGWCRPLDIEDFTARDWVPESGWPITRADLKPYYEAAHEVCDLGPAGLQRRDLGALRRPDSGALRTRPADAAVADQQTDPLRRKIRTRAVCGQERRIAARVQSDESRSGRERTDHPTRRGRNARGWAVPGRVQPIRSRLRRDRERTPAAVVE